MDMPVSRAARLVAGGDDDARKLDRVADGATVGGGRGEHRNLGSQPSEIERAEAEVSAAIAAANR
jgi:hypothetical protein